MAHFASSYPLLLLVLIFYNALAETPAEIACADLCGFLSGCSPDDGAFNDVFCSAQYYAVAFLCLALSIALCVTAFLAANEEQHREP